MGRYAGESTAVVLERLAARRVLRARLDADEAELLARLASDPDPYGDGLPDARDFMVEDVAATLRVASGWAARELGAALELVSCFPATLAAMAAGRITRRYAATLLELTQGLQAEVRTRVEAAVLPAAGSQTVGQFAAAVRRTVAAVDPERFRTEAQAAVARRRVVFTHLPDGTTELWAVLPPVEAEAMRAQIAARAALYQTFHDGRGADQRRADALVDLVLGRCPAPPGGGGDPTPPATGTAPAPGPSPSLVVTVTVSMDTLLGVSERPGELGDGTLISSDAARAAALAATRRWRRQLLDAQGRVAYQGSEQEAQRYRPSATLARAVRTRDRTCQFPTCTRPATAQNIELDHVTAHGEGGRTMLGNLQTLCRRHHHLKHDAGWQITRHPDGSTTWTSPTGRTYRRPPPEPPP